MKASRSVGEGETPQDPVRSNRLDNVVSNSLPQAALQRPGTLRLSLYRMARPWLITLADRRSPQSGECPMNKAHLETVWAPRSFYPALNGGDAALLYCLVFLFIAAAGGAWSLDRILRSSRMA